MKKILGISSSVKGQASFSIQLSNAIIEKITSTYPGSQVKQHDLTKTPFPHLEETHLGAFFTPIEAQTVEQKKAIKHSNEAIAELMEADIIVIGVPMYNFTITSTLKAWIDHVVRAGITFSYATGVPIGLVNNKKVYLAIASGGIYTEGPMQDYDFTEPYLRKVLGFIGLTDITAFRIEGVVMPESKDKAVQKAMDAVNGFAF